tara:strand:- start:2037 stop:2675 length:639 start_codon:yes stop_codon:yes gene_type:complete
MATTKLQAVNTLLSIIGEAPVNSLVPPLTGDTSLADSVLDEISKEIQGEGWSWNTMLYDQIPLDTNGHSSLPSNTLAIRFNPVSYPSQRFVLRGVKLFDRVRNTYDLRGSLGVALTGTTQSDLVAEVVEELAWDDVPETGKRYIMIRSGRIFSNRAITSTSIEAYTQEDEENARQILKRTEDMAQNNNFISGPDDLYDGRVMTVFGPDILNR